MHTAMTVQLAACLQRFGGDRQKAGGIMRRAVDRCHDGGDGSIGVETDRHSLHITPPFRDKIGPAIKTITHARSIT